MQIDGERRPSQRLPVNPRRHKVAPEQRKRVAKACNSCNVRRIKCSGERPCASCASANRECVYPAPIEKVSVSKSELDDLKKKVELYEKALQDALPDPAKRHELLQHAAGSPPSATSPTQSPFSASNHFAPSISGQSTIIKPEPIDDDHTTGRILHDSDGTARFHGETSGAIFLDHLKELICAVLPLAHHQQPAPHDGSAFLSSLGKCFTDDSRPLDEKDVDPLLLPPLASMVSMLSEVRFVVQDGNGSWPSGGIYWFGDLAQPPQLPVLPPSQAFFDPDAYRSLAFPHAAFAVAAYSTCPWPFIDEPENFKRSDSFLARASMLLRNPLDIGHCSIQDVSAFALMAYHLVEINRRDSAYMHIAAASHLCIMLGAHRGWADEKGKRIFWTVYILDRWVSCLMGRPPVIVDDVIRIPLPSDAAGMPPAAGLRAHAELSRISGYVVCNTYRIAPWDSVNGSGDSSQSPGKVMRMLEQWKSTLPSRLQLSPDNLSKDPACVMLHMRYNQLIIVATRPLFFIAVKKSVAERLIPQGSSKEYNIQLAHLRTCIDAARNNIKLARHFITIKRHPKPFHALIHYCFTASVCLILESLVYPQQSATPDQNASFSADMQFVLDILHGCERLKSDPGDKSCTETLHDLQILVARLTTPVHLDPQISNPHLQALGLTNSFPQPPPPPMPIESEPALYNELANWMDDDWFMHGTYMD
ncbi:hypothetical protein MY11210_003733 [Beauveria gryllotalpidicola]